MEYTHELIFMDGKYPRYYYHSPTKSVYTLTGNLVTTDWEPTTDGPWSLRETLPVSLENE